jgi:hypothetical protein
MLRDARVVEFAADKGQQRGLDLGVGKFRAAGDETDDGSRHFLGNQLAAGLEHRTQRLGTGHARESHPVLRDRRHHAFQVLEMREVVLAQRDQDAVVAAREVEALDSGFVLVHLRLERLWRPILDQVGQVFHELRRALAAEVVALRQREQFLELVEDQQRDERLARLIAQDVVAMVQELPQRFAGYRGARLRPRACGPRRAKNRLLDLFGRHRRIGRVVDAHIDRTVAFGPQPRHDARAQDRRLAQARLAKEDREQLACTRRPVHRPPRRVIEVSPVSSVSDAGPNHGCSASTTVHVVGGGVRRRPRGRPTRSCHAGEFA